MLVETYKTVATDKKFGADEIDAKFSNYVFSRPVALKRKFTNVDFKYSFFDGGYFRNCVFDSCNFTGCRFSNTQFPGTKFLGSKFDYATFEKTLIDHHILDTECPAHENLKSRFARSLRVNFQQLGDARAANKAIKVELAATAIHLKKAWQSNEAYYRSHYPGTKRLLVFFEWLGFKILDFVWGNGENLSRLLRLVFLLLILMTIRDALVSCASSSQPFDYLAGIRTFIFCFFWRAGPRQLWRYVPHAHHLHPPHDGRILFVHHHQEV